MNRNTDYFHISTAHIHRHPVIQGPRNATVECTTGENLYL